MRCHTVELAAQTNREVTDVDHLLHLTQTFLQRLTHFVAHQGTERILLLTEGISELADHLPPFGRRNSSPFNESRLRRSNDSLVFFLGRAGKRRNDVAVDRRNGFDDGS